MLFDTRFDSPSMILVDNFAAFEHGEAVGKAKHKRNMLLNDEHSHPLIPACPARSLDTRSTTDG